jgi:hypothetical protein
MEYEPAGKVQGFNGATINCNNTSERSSGSRKPFGQGG